MILFSLTDYKYLARPLLKSTDLRRGFFSADRYRNQEIHLSIKNKVRGEKCIVLGGTAPPDEELLILLLLTHTLKKEGAKEVTVLIPYLGYARQDQREKGKSLAAQLVGEMLHVSGVDKVVTVDVHSALVPKLFVAPLISLSPAELFANEIKKLNLQEITLVAPDEGAIERCRFLNQTLGLKNDIAYFSKKRTQKEVITQSLHGKVTRQAVIVDDILDTGETLIGACKKLRQLGVKNISIAVTHALFTGQKWQKLWSLGVDRIYCTNSIPQTRQAADRKIIVLPLEKILAEYFSWK